MTHRETRRARRVVRAAAAGVVLGLLAAGCGGASGDAGGDDAASTATGTTPADRADGDLVVWTDEAGEATVAPTVRAFAADKGVTARVQVVAPGGLVAAVAAANTAGEGPDVVVTGSDGLADLLANGAVAPLALQRNDAARYSPRALETVTADDVLYGLPYAVDAVALLRDAAVVPDEPRTLEDLVAAARAAGAPRPLCLPVGETGSPEHLYPLYRSAGGYLFGRTPGGALDLRDVGVGEEGSLVAADRFAGMAADGLLATDVTRRRAAALFADRQCPFLVAGAEALPAATEAGIRIEVSPLPGFAGLEPAVPLTSSRALFVTSKARSSELAGRFVLDVVNRPDTMLALYGEGGGTPAMTEVVRLVSGDAPAHTGFAAAAEDGEVLPAVPAVAEVWDPLGRAEAAVVGGADPAETMRWAGEQVRERVDAAP